MKKILLAVALGALATTAGAEEIIIDSDIWPGLDIRLEPPTWYDIVDEDDAIVSVGDQDYQVYAGTAWVDGHATGFDFIAVPRE